MTVPVWRFARESKGLFVGPITVTATANGTPVTSGIRFAVLAVGQRPVDADWSSPAPEPGGDGIGVILSAVDQPGRYGLWVQVTAGDTTDELEPTDVAWIDRT